MSGSMIELTVNVDTAQFGRNLNGLQTRIAQAQEDALREVKDGIVHDLSVVTTTWTWHKPTFRADITGSGNKRTFRVWTNSRVFGFVDQGTRGPYPIYPRKPDGVLAFQWGGPGSYIAKSLPGWMAARQGGATGPTRFFRHVMHPGIKARGFTKAVAAKWRDKVQSVVMAHIRNAISGISRGWRTTWGG